MDNTALLTLVRSAIKYTAILQVVLIFGRPIFAPLPGIFTFVAISGLALLAVAWHLSNLQINPVITSSVYFFTVSCAALAQILLSGGVLSHYIYLLPLITVFAPFLIGIRVAWVVFISLLIVVAAMLIYHDQLPTIIPIEAVSQRALLVKGMGLITAMLFGSFLAAYCVQQNRALWSTLTEQAQHDYLTQVLNRRGIDAALSREMARAKRLGLSLSVMMLDIDKFKKYNDKYGHVAGDRCLSHIALTLKPICARFGATIGRYGGEEFLVVVSGMAETEVAELADHLLKGAYDVKCDTAGQSVITISIGYAYLPKKQTCTEQQLLKTADDALYDSKHRGRDQVNSRRIANVDYSEAFAEVPKSPEMAV